MPKSFLLTSLTVLFGVLSSAVAFHTPYAPGIVQRTSSITVSRGLGALRLQSRRRNAYSSPKALAFMDFDSATQVLQVKPMLFFLRKDDISIIRIICFQPAKIATILIGLKQIRGLVSHQASSCPRTPHPLLLLPQQLLRPMRSPLTTRRLASSFSPSPASGRL